MPANEAHLGEGGPSRVEPKYLDLGRNKNMHTHMTHKHVSTRGTDVCGRPKTTATTGAGEGGYGNGYGGYGFGTSDTECPCS